MQNQESRSRAFTLRISICMMIARLSKLLSYKVALRVSEVRARTRSESLRVQRRSVHILRPRSLIRVEYAINARVGVRHRSASGRRGVEEADGTSDEERRRDRTARRK